MSEIPEKPIEIWEEKYNGKKAISTKLSVLRQFKEWLQEDESRTNNVLKVDIADIQDWLDYIYHERGLAGSTVHQYQTDLRGFYNDWIHQEGDYSSLAEEYGQLGRNTAAFNLSAEFNYSKTADKQAYANNNEGIIHVRPSEVRDMQEEAESVRDELLVKMLYQTGLRRAELAALKLPEYKSESHIDTERGVVVITDDDSKTKDGGRTVPYEDLEPELTLWLKQGFRDRHCYADESPYLFLTKQTPQISVQTISRIIRQLAEEAGVQEIYGKDADGNPKRRITAHSLRSAFVIRLFDAGISSPKIMEYSGHEQLETVEKYANVLGEDAIEAYREADIDW